jgi:hypothetical protein
VLRPYRFDPVRAGFFFREPDGSVHASSSRNEFVIRQRAAALKPSAAEPAPAEPVEPSAAQPPAVIPDERLAAPPRRLAVMPPVVHSQPGRKMWLLAALAGIAVAAGALMFWIGNPRGSAGLTLHTFDVNGQLRIDWSCTPAVVEHSENGALEIEDGPNKLLNALSRDQLRAGSVTYSRTTGNVLVHLRVRGVDRSTFIQTARFLGAPAPAPSATPEAAKPAQGTATPPETPQKTQPEKAQAEAPRPSPAPPPAPVSTPPVSATAPESAAKAPPRRQLQLPSRVIPESAEIPVGAPPPIAVNHLPSMTTAIPHLPAPTLPAAPPAPAKRTDHIAQSGKIIWTGRLARRGTIQITGDHASTGQITGGLPGAPVRVRVFPAELTQDGFRVYTADPKSVEAPEAPGVQNGWNQTTYVLNPRQAGDIKVVEAPGNQNGWNRLVLRAERGDHIVIIVRWERLPER